MLLADERLNDFVLIFASRLNDIIVRVNDTEIQNVPHQNAVDALKKTGNIVNLVSILIT